ncbi:SDR family NAD(P)-dependent oxidoreductase [Marispirochaeta sp.]|uniref:SDR family NAD(P)-dependent oxidoreductase n=1 Tax=Marispirochaeta sp. TaxID=2038653 RepID=UPI0029C8505C|nr:SDR family NAD(P)-dependent oxidoreductase [Marispirochaeta sp.]
MTHPLFDVTGKKAIVTGASRGLGLGMAEGFLEAGCEVVLMARSDQLDDVVQKFCRQRYKAYGVKGDLGNREEIQRMFDESMRYLGDRVDILVTAAGIQRRHRSDLFPIQDWDTVINVNLNSVFILDQLCAQKMIKQGKGKIINITSMVSWFGGINVPAYTAAKGAVTQMTKCMGNDWASLGINVNAIAPGYMATEMNEKLIQDKVRYAEITNRIPAGRWGEPGDMKGPAIFLASAASDYLSGVIIPVDGGYLSR